MGKNQMQHFIIELVFVFAGVIGLAVAAPALCRALEELFF
jgi:hypothetical protein